ncbi:hypothetical protein DFH27DRAFT_146526 [Peziza echinospora]|nr:hypothetical protein DFH27DRAFT_146526 [Peziza echinospora]
MFRARVCVCVCFARGGLVSISFFDYTGLFFPPPFTTFFFSLMSSLHPFFFHLLFFPELSYILHHGYPPLHRIPFRYHINIHWELNYAFSPETFSYIIRFCHFSFSPLFLFSLLSFFLL